MMVVTWFQNGLNEVRVLDEQSLAIVKVHIAEEFAKRPPKSGDANRLTMSVYELKFGTLSLYGHLVLTPTLAWKVETQLF